MKRIRRLIQICGLVLAICFLVKVGVFIDRASENAAPKMARDEEQRRETAFLTATARSSEMAATSCPDDVMPSPVFIRSAEAKALSLPRQNEGAWELICGTRITPASRVQHWTTQWCQFLDLMVTSRQIDGSGKICVDADGSWFFGRSQSQYEGPGFDQWTRWSGWPDKGRSKIGNFRFKVEHCRAYESGPPDNIHLNDPEQCLVTIWASTQRKSWGQYLENEFRTSVSFDLWTAVALAGGTLLILILTVRRIVVVSLRPYPYDPVPWVFRVPLLAVALDHEPEYVNGPLYLYELEYANRGMRQWLFIGPALQIMPFLIVRRIINLFQQAWSPVVMTGGWILRTALRRLG